MSAGVLTVLEREAMDRMASGFPRQADEIHEARAAVAELIEALRSAREWHLGDKYRGGSDEEQLAWRNQLARYDAALARAQGGGK